MANPSPICTVKDGAGAAQVTTNGVNVTATNTITIALTSTAGVDEWTIELYGKDELVAAPTLTIDNTLKTATFTAPAAGSALIFRSTVNNGREINGVVQSTYVATFGVYVLTANGLRVAAINETLEGSATSGWVTKINTLIRNPYGITGPVSTGAADSGGAGFKVLRVPN